MELNLDSELRQGSRELPRLLSDAHALDELCAERRPLSLERVRQRDDSTSARNITPDRLEFRSHHLWQL